MVARLIPLVIESLGKQCVELRNEGALTTKDIDQTGDVLRNEEGVLEGQAFGDERGGFSRDKRGDPGAIGMASAREAGPGSMTLRQFSARFAKACASASAPRAFAIEPTRKSS